MDFSSVLKYGTPHLIEGAKITISIALISIVIGLVIGFVSCLMRLSKNPILKAISMVYVWVIRGTPMIVQAYIIFFGYPEIYLRLTGDPAPFSQFWAGVLTLSLNGGAYLSEVFRGGIQAVPIGQTEAARSLGLSSFKTMMKVVLPQAFKISLPSMINQFIITIKDTSILSAVALVEIINKARQYAMATYVFFETYLLVGIFYLVIISALMVLSMFVEKWLSTDKKNVAPVPAKKNSNIVSNAKEVQK